MDEELIKSHAYQLWQEAGCPDGREIEFWEKAKELAAIEENQKGATKTVPRGRRERPWQERPWNEPVEPAESIENQGEFPGLADQGEEQPRSPHYDPSGKSKSRPG